MISIIIFFLFFLVTLKEFIFFSKMFFMDNSSMFLSCICPLIFLLITMMLFTYTDLKDKASYNFFFSLLIFLNLFCYFSNFSLLYLLFIELTVLPMTFLILNFSKDVDKISSLMFMVFINVLGSVPFMYFSSFMLESNFSMFNSLSNLSLSSFNSIFIYFSMILILVSKLPLFLFHFWLTKAHVSASGSSSMILASLMLKLGSFGIYKFSVYFICTSMLIFSVISSFSLWGSLIFCMIMLRFFDIKYLIACSSILHMSTIFPGVMMFSSHSVSASMMMMVGHGLVSYILFMLISLIYEVSMNRNMDLNKSLESYSKTFSLSFFIYIFMNIGVPPLMNFLSEMYFTFFFWKFSNVGLLMFSFVMVLSIVFFMFLSTKVLFGKKNSFMISDFNYMSINLSFIYLLFLISCLFMV